MEVFRGFVNKIYPLLLPLVINPRVSGIIIGDMCLLGYE